MDWKRPTDIPYPTVWHEFEGRKPLDDGNIPRFKVQDVPEDIKEDYLDFLVENFARDEPTCRSINFNSCPLSMQTLRTLYEKCLLDNVALMCVLDESLKPGKKPTIVGVNITAIARKSDKNEDHTKDPEPYRKVIKAVHVLFGIGDVFNRFNVNEYLVAYGLIVHPKYRGQNIGAELLKSRIPLCKALGIKLTCTVFTNSASQYSADKAGFQTIAEVTYEDLKEKHLCDFPNLNEVSSKLMVLQIE